MDYNFLNLGVKVDIDTVFLFLVFSIHKLTKSTAFPEHDVFVWKMIILSDLRERGKVKKLFKRLGFVK